MPTLILPIYLHFNIPSEQLYWTICWKYITPLVLCCLLIFELFHIGEFKYDQNYIYPWPIQILGYAITASSMIWIPIYMIIEKSKMTTENDSNWSSMWLLKPTPVSTIWLKKKIAIDDFFSLSIRTGVDKKNMEQSMLTSRWKWTTRWQIRKCKSDILMGKRNSKCGNNARPLADVNSKKL